MKLKRLRIEGYKSISSGLNRLALDLADVNIVIGAHGSGKSNLVSFFSLLSYLFDGRLQHYMEKSCSVDNLLHYGISHTREMKIEFDLEDSTLRSYCYTLNVSEQGRLELIIEDNEHEAAAPALISEYKIENYRFCNLSKLGDLLMTLKNTPEYRKYYDRIIRRIQMVMPQFLDFDFQKNPQGEIILNWRDTSEKDYKFGPDQISEGSQRFISLAILLLQPPVLLPDLIVIDEPELKIHPMVLSVLGGMIKTVSRYTQIILVTHSPRLLDELGLQNLIVSEWDKESHCSRFTRLDESRIQPWLKEYCLSELWEKGILTGKKSGCEGIK